MATMQEAVDRARALLQDTVTPYRYTDADLLAYGNDALDVMVGVKPELFMSTTTHTCVSGAKQQLSPATWFGLVRVVGVANGNAMLEIDGRSLDAFTPEWRKATASRELVEWFKVPGDKIGFYVNPPAVAGTVLDVQGVLLPPDYLLADPLPDLLTPYVNVIADFITGVAEAREDENAAGAKVQQFVGLFIQKLAGLSPAEAGTKRQ